MCAKKIHKTIFISAGETSGDLLGANLAHALWKKDSTLHLMGMGGKQMHNAGVTICFNSEKLAVVGAIEIITQFFLIVRMWRAIKRYFMKTKPDLVIFIDFPDTHFRFFKILKKLGIPVLYYVGPQIWAWRASRIHTLKKYVNHMAVLFSFEEKIYQRERIPVTFVGHPLSQLTKPSMSMDEAYAFFQLNRDQKIIALFPGSRLSELKNHLSLMIETVNHLRTKHPTAQFVLVLANHFDIKQYRDKIPSYVKIIQNNLYDFLQITTIAIAVSGTITLEIALMQVPLCIVYRMHPLSFWIARKLIRTKYIGLCNIVSDVLIAKELIQTEATPENITNEVNALLMDTDYYLKAKMDLKTVKDKISLPDQNTSNKVADIAIQLLETCYETKTYFGA